MRPHIHYVNEHGEDVYIAMPNKTIEEIDALASKIKHMLPHNNVDVYYEGVAL